MAEEEFPAPSAFLDANEGDQVRAAIKAQRILEDELRYLGEAASTDQALSLPRVGLEKRGGQGCYESDEIPPESKRAQGALTFWLLQQVADGVDPTAVPDDVGVTQVSLGSELSMSLAPEQSAKTPLEGFIGSTIRPLVAHLVYSSAMVRTGRG